ncbi:amino acid ABC transporter ATP-binding protein [Variovorax sp. J31P207]|uniref:amino acid ABC transporter ATP-binding protein n=1 Tax=Variovorax sp. J31P207 TaxID=3053510 RepID=UPI0025780829|nr:amino acid ABC transporter ATP-binding protein [Variovorax sp. J31P207]MDM0071610.1 amino acid ABC transporter ATP-binding protein [Variovorax sp. J31P207]
MMQVVIARNVCKRYGATEVLKDVSLEVAQGEVLGIIGPSGAGKSTLLRCLNQLEGIDSGDLYVNGEFAGYRVGSDAFHQLPDAEVARQRAATGMVFQRFNLFAHKTVLDNVTLGPIVVRKATRRAAEAHAVELLAQVGLGGFEARYPSQLSGGQQQRVAIARALAMQPTVLLFDEPTSALDSELVGEVLDVMRDLAASGQTMLVVTHELAFARAVCSRIAFMEAGRIVEVGTPQQIFNQPLMQRTREFVQRATSPVSVH